MDLLDIRGIELRAGQDVAFARVTGGTLAQGTIVQVGRGASPLLVRLASSGREVFLPYHAGKYVVLAYNPPQETLETRIMAAWRAWQQSGGHYNVFTIDNVRAMLGLVQADAHRIYLALENLVESGELRRAAWPRYAYMLGE